VLAAVQLPAFDMTFPVAQVRPTPDST
jgi:hypothetical protein